MYKNYCIATCMVIIVCECFWWLRITLILFLAFNSQGPKALAEVQRGWHQKLRQLVKQPLSKGFLFAFQSIPNVPLFKLSKDTTLRYVLSVYYQNINQLKNKKVEDSRTVWLFWPFRWKPIFFPRLLVRSYTNASRSKSSLYLALLCNSKIWVAD